MQEAYEHLSNPDKRREYDSIDEFDDSLPESCAPEDFYRVRSHRSIYTAMQVAAPEQPEGSRLVDSNVANKREA